MSREEFFGQRARLSKNLDAVLNKFSEIQLNLGEYGSIKKALGLSINSVVHKWDKTGIDNIEGYVTHIEHLTKLMNPMRTVGFVGIGLDFSRYTSSVYDACLKGREGVYRKAVITEYSKLGLEQGSSILAGAVTGRVATTLCTWALRISIMGAGGVGATLYFVMGIGVTIASGKITEKYGEDAGKKLGNYVGDHIIYGNFFHSKQR